MLYFVITMVITACSSPSAPPPQPPLNNPPNNPTQPSSGKPDLTLGETYIESNNDAYLSYQIVATISNLGNAEANGFNAGCTYQCPTGDPYISGGLDIVQGGYIGPNSSFTYKSPFHYMCTVSTPTVDLVCTIEASDGSAKTFSVAQRSLP
jgi:hypothetical protein